MLIGTQRPIKVLCCREYQNSIDDSVLSLLIAKAEEIDPDFYVVKNNKIHGKNGTVISFIGLARNIGSVKSLEGIDLVWVEEGQYISAKAWEILEPTIRKDGSQFLISMNRDSEESKLDRTFIQQEPPPRTLRTTVNYYDNPFDIPTLIESAEHCKKTDYEAYQHIWLGELNNVSKAQVLSGKWRTAKFTAPANVVYYHGADWSNGGADPHTLVRCYIDKNTLYIDAEIKTNVDEDSLADVWRTMDTLDDNQQWVIYCDESRPNIINKMRKLGFRTRAARKKWSGTKSSIRAGIGYLRSFDEIVIHEDCIETIKEAKNWKWKIDDRSGDILPELVSGYDHIFDAVRYSLVQMVMRHKK